MFSSLEFRMLRRLAITSKITSLAIILLLFPSLFAIVVDAHLSPKFRLLQQQESLQSDALWNSNITQDLFDELKELARLADISYCVGSYGISKPFVCATHCKEFPNFELIETFHSTYSKFGDCGFIAVDHGSGQNDGRILVVFRGTHSISDAILDLLVVPQKYVPYPVHEKENFESQSKFLQRPIHHITQHPFLRIIRRASRLWSRRGQSERKYHNSECTNCTVHLGFLQNYQIIRHLILSNISSTQKKYPKYQLNLVGHSLGGAVAALAALELESLGYLPTVTTFGEPRIGNSGLRDYIDATFNLRSENSKSQTDLPSSKSRYRRVTHANDPFPLLPTKDLGYRSHAGEIFISKRKTPPTVENLRLCFGDDDMNCIEGGESGETFEKLLEIIGIEAEIKNLSTINRVNELKKRGRNMILPPNLIQLFLSHIDYFSRMDLCLLPDSSQENLRKDEV